MIRRRCSPGLFAALLAVVVGCDNSSSTTAPAAPAKNAVSPGPFGPPVALPIMKPFEGDWRFSLDKTLAHWKTDGVPQKEIDSARALAKSFPLHEDMTIAGNTSILRGRGTGEYYFYALHPHARWACGKGWHHEDRNDPGDMSKCLARLQLLDADLHLSLRHHEDAADPNDPEVASPPALAGSAARCSADAEKDPPWSAWRTYVFERERK